MKVLITGGTGLLGKSLLEEAPAGVQPAATAVTDPRGLIPASCDGAPLDLRDRSRVLAYVARVRPQAIIHTASIGSVDYAERHPEETWAVNVEGTRHVLDAAMAVGAHLIFVSSNAVFDGTRAPYREEDPVCPVNTYGRFKVEAEQLVAGQSAIPVTIVRPILMYGWHHPTERVNPVTWILRELSQGKTVPVVTDVYTNPLWAPSGARAIWRMVAQRVTGIFHLAGRDRVDRYTFAQETARVFGCDASHLKPVTSDYFPDIAPRAPDTSYDTTKMARVLGVEPMGLREGLEAMRRTQPSR